MNLLVSVLVLLIIIGVAIWVVDMTPMAPPFKAGARVVLGLVALLWLLHAFGLVAGGLRLP